MALSFDIEVPRQGDWFKELQLTDVDGVPIDLTGHTLLWNARVIAGAGLVVGSAVISVVEANGGYILAQWHGPDFDDVGIATERVRVAHDLKDTYPDGKVDVVLRGQLILYPKVTA